MAPSIIDTLLQISVPARPVEPAARGRSAQNSFVPALEKAYAAEKPREAAPTEGEEAPVESSVDQATDSHDTDEERAEKADAFAESGAPDEDRPEGEEDSSDDAVEISELASTAAAAEEAQAAVLAAQGDVAAAELVGEAAGADAVEGVTDLPLNAEAALLKDKASQRDLAPGREEGLQEEGASGDSRDAAKITSVKNLKHAKGSSPDEKQVTKVAEKPKDDAGVGEQSPEADEATEEKMTTSVEVSAEDVETRESRNAKGEVAERVKLPLVEPSAELAAAGDRNLASIEPSRAPESRGADAAAAPSVDGINNGAQSQRGAATLDRLETAAMRRADNGGASESGPAIDRPRFVQRVEGAIRAAQQRDGRVQVRLAPPELGSLRIELSVQNGVMAAKLEAETPAARNALLDNLPALRERLAEQNIRVEKFDVDIRRDSQGSGGNNGPHDRPANRQDTGGHNRRGRQSASPMATTATRSTRADRPVSDAGLDVRI